MDVQLVEQGIAVLFILSAEPPEAYVTHKRTFDTEAVKTTTS